MFIEQHIYISVYSPVGFVSHNDIYMFWPGGISYTGVRIRGNICP